MIDLKNKNFENQVKTIAIILRKSEKSLELSEIIAEMAARKITTEDYLRYFQDGYITENIETVLFGSLSSLSNQYIPLVIRALGVQPLEQLLNNPIPYILELIEIDDLVKKYKDNLIENKLLNSNYMKYTIDNDKEDKLKIITSLRPFGQEFYINEGILYWCTGQRNEEGIEYARDLLFINDIQNIVFKDSEIEIVNYFDESTFITKDGVEDECERAERLAELGK